MAINIDINDQILENQMHALQACMTVDSEMGKRLRELIFQELKRVRNDIAGGLKFANGDPRGTRGAVKRYIASKYLGGVVSILDGKASGNRNSYEAPRKLRPGQRGGNRMLRSQRTDDILHYGPDERSFILRFTNLTSAVLYFALPTLVLIPAMPTAETANGTSAATIALSSNFKSKATTIAAVSLPATS